MAERTGLEVKLRFFPLAFLFLVCVPRVVIDGETHKRYWGTHFFPVAPGRHRVEIYFRYLFVKTGANVVEVEVPAGGVRQVKYFMWPWILSKGALIVEK